MEERLDDAINVLRNHAESQLGLVGQLPNNLAAHQMTQLGYTAPPPSDPHLPDPVKVERPTYNTSKYVTTYQSKINIRMIGPIYSLKFNISRVVLKLKRPIFFFLNTSVIHQKY